MEDFDKIWYVTYISVIHSTYIVFGLSTYMERIVAGRAILRTVSTNYSPFTSEDTVLAVLSNPSKGRCELNLYMAA